MPPTAEKIRFQVGEFKLEANRAVRTRLSRMDGSWKQRAAIDQTGQKLWQKFFRIEYEQWLEWGANSLVSSSGASVKRVLLCSSRLN